MYNVSKNNSLPTVLRKLTNNSTLIADWPKILDADQTIRFLASD